MAVTLDGPGGLFTRLGRIFGAMALIDAQRGTPIGVAFDEVAEAYDGDESLIATLYTALASHRSSSGSAHGRLAAIAASTIVDMVGADDPQPDSSLRTALIALIRQMEDQGESVQGTTVSASVSYDGANVGDPTVVVSTRLPSGRACEHAAAEDIVGEIVSDGQSGGGATRGRELARIRGERSVGPFAWDWPKGSGGSTNVPAVDAADDRAGGLSNWTRNGDFSDWTGSVPDYWSIDEGSAAELSSSGYEGEGLVITGDGSTSTTVSQAFGSSSGSTVSFRPAQQVAVRVVLRVDVVPAAGALRLALVDGSGSVIDDDEGSPNAASIDLTAATTSFVAHAATFRTPSQLPESISLQLRLTTPLSAGTDLVLDEVALAEMQPVYRGGPGVCVFSGATPMIRGDRFAIAVTNSNRSGFQAWFDRAFGMRGLGLLLPSSGSPTIPDDLITASSSGS